MHFLKHLLKPPQFTDEEKTYQAYLLNIILLTLLAVPIPLTIYLLIWKPGELHRVLAFIAFAEIVNLVLFIMVRRGFVRQAAIAHTLTLWTIFAISSITRSGIYGIPYTLGNGLVIVIAGILLGKRGAQIITLLIVAQGGAMVYTQTRGWVPSYTPTDPVYSWVIAGALFVIIVNIQALASNQINATLKRAQSSEERYRLISEISSDYTFSTEFLPEGGMRLVWVAGAFEKITGFTFDEYAASGGWLAHLHPDELAKDAENIATIKTNTPVITEVQTIKKNGDLCWVRVYANPIWNEKEKRVTGVVGAVQDITRQKQAELSLVQERDLLQIFMDNIPDHVYYKDTESRFIRINKAQAAFLGLNDPQDAVGKTDLDFQPFELAKQFMDEEKKVMGTGQPIANRVEFNPTEDGRPRWLSASKTPVWDSSGKLLGTIGISRDITGQKQIEAMLAYERDILQIFMDNIPDQVYFKDAESRFVRINQGQAQFLGVEHPEDAIGKTDVDFQTPELAQAFLAEENRIMETGQPVLNRIELNPTKDGTPRWLSTSKVPARNEFGHVIGTIGISFDITEQKLAEERESNRRATLEKVIRLGKQVTEVSDLQTTLKKIWNGVRNELHFDRLGIFLYNPEQNSVDGSYGTNRQGEMVDESELHISLDKETEEALSFLRVLQEENGSYVTHNYTDERQVPTGDIMHGVKDYAAVAMWAGKKPMGVICADNLLTGRSIIDNDLEALRLFAGYAGLAIENARLNDAIQNELQEKKQAEESEQNRRLMLEKVIHIGKQVAEVSDLKTTLEKIWYALHDGLGFDRIGIFAYQPETNLINRIFGTDMHGNRDDTKGEPVPASGWHAFQLALEKPNGFYFTHDFSQEASIPEGQEMYGVKDYATVAAWAGGKPVAVIAVDQLITQRPITEHQLEGLRLFAGYAGLAIENARLKDAIQNELEEKKQAEETEQRRRKMLEKIVRLGKHVAEVSDLQTTLERIWQILRNDLGFDRLGIFFYDPERNVMDRALGTDRQGNMDKTAGISVNLSEWTIFQAVLDEPNGFYMTHNFDVENKMPEHNEMYGVKDYAAVAVWAGNVPAGVICVDNVISGRHMGDEELEALRLFAGYAGLAIENSRLKDAIQNELDEKKQAEALAQRRRQTLEKVMRLGKQVTEVSDLRTTLKKMWHGIRNELDFDRVGLFVYNPQANNMVGAYGTDREGKIWDAWHVTFELDENSLFYKVLVQPNGFYFTTDYEKEFNLPPDHEMTGVKYAALVAVWSGNKPIALISVDQLLTGRPILDEQLEALRLFAGYAGLAISNSHLNDALQEELSQRQKFIDELEAKNAELERFTYTASHDLKSPLVTITGFLGYLEKDALAGNQERMKSSIARINSAAEKMQALLNDLLELSRIGRLMNPPEDIPFTEIVHEAVDRVRGHLDEANAVIEIQKDFPTVNGDRVRLVEVLQNLIENAVKYARPDTNPRIEIGSSSPDQDGNVTFHVHDNGIGIPSEYHERIFGLFNKLDPHSEGTGIGLSLVKRIIEVHNGRVWVESEKGRGATFYFSLPTSQTKE